MAKVVQLITTLAAVALFGAVSSGVSSRTATAAANVYRDEALGIEFEYPGSWVEGAPDAPFRPCSRCVIFGPPQALHPYGVRLLPSPWVEGCRASCYVIGSIGRAQEGPERALSIRGRPATRAEIRVMPPLGLINETGDDTPYHETYTYLRLDDQALLFVAFYRDGDTAAEEETLSAYEELLESLKFIGEGALPDTGSGPPPANGSSGQMASVLVAVLVGAIGLALLSAAAINRRQAKQ